MRPFKQPSQALARRR